METVKKRDWSLIIIGVLLAVCGMVFFFSPIGSLITLTIFAGAFFVVAGVFDIINYFRFNKTGMMSGWVIVYGILDIIIGLMLIVHPIALAAVIPWIIGVFVVVFGAFECIESFNLKKRGFQYWWWTLISGILSVIIGLLFFFVPASVIIYLAIFLMVRGISLVVFGWNGALEA